MNPALPVSSAKSSRRKRGFTLVEVLIASIIGIVVLAAVMTLVLVAAQLYYKNQMVADAANDSRAVQEHINSHLSRAINQFKDAEHSASTLPTFGDPGSNEMDPSHTQRYGMLKYRMSLGSPATVVGDTSQTATDTITLLCPPDVLPPQSGDYLLLNVEPLGHMDNGTMVGGAPIVSVNDTRTVNANLNPIASGNVILKLQGPIRQL